MSFFSNLSIKARIISLVTVMGVLAALFMFIYLPFKSNQLGITVMTETYTNEVELLAQNLENALKMRILDDGEAMETILDPFDNNTLEDGVTRAAIFDENSSLLFGVGPNNQEMKLEATVEEISYTQTEDHIEFVAPLLYDSSDPESEVIGYFKILFSKQLLTDNIASIRWTTLVFSLIAIAIFVIVAIWFAERLNRPILDSIRTLQETSQSINDSSQQFSSTSQEMADGASQQASSLEETSASLEELSSMTKRNAESSQQANSLAEEARKAATEGNQSMNKMNDSMNELKSSTEETSKIIKAIDEIAFQTNLLALNAAVEAARAGTAGQGFAVVAEEVRRLALRTSDAAKETEAIIERSRQAASGGVSMAQEVAEILEDIDSKSQKVNELVAEITAASMEQSQGLDQINRAMSHVDSVTQKNAAGAEENASAAETLRAESNHLQSIVRSLSELVKSDIQKNGGMSGSSSNGKRKSNKQNQSNFDDDFDFDDFDDFDDSSSGSQKKRSKSSSNSFGSGDSSPADVLPMDDDFEDF